MGECMRVRMRARVCMWDYGYVYLHWCVCLYLCEYAFVFLGGHLFSRWKAKDKIKWLPSISFFVFLSSTVIQSRDYQLIHKKNQENYYFLKNCFRFAFFLSTISVLFCCCCFCFLTLSCWIIDLLLLRPNFFGVSEM